MHDALHPLADAFDEYRVDEQLHDVPPHAVYAVTVDGRRAVFKRDTGPTGNAGVEGRVMAFVGDHADLPVPEVLAVGDDWYLAAWHPAAPDLDDPRDPDQDWARVAGRGLATLHAGTAPQLDAFGRFGRNGDGLALPGEDDWHAAAANYVRRLRGVLADCGHADVADAALDYLHAHPDAFAGGGGPVCCHGWWSPEHVAVEDGAVTCVIDFEHALAAPGEWDYWRTVLPVFDGGQAQRAFREGYEAVRALPDGLDDRRPLYALLHSLYYFESLYVQAQHPPDETAERATWLREVAFDTLDGLP